MSFKVAEMRLRQALIPYPVDDLPHVEMARNVAVCTKRTCWGRLTVSAPEGKTDVPREPGHFRF